MCLVNLHPLKIFKTFKNLYIVSSPPAEGGMKISGNLDSGGGNFRDSGGHHFAGVILSAGVTFSENFSPAAG